MKSREGNEGERPFKKSLKMIAKKLKLLDIFQKGLGFLL
jgi:hypothetical protein